MNTIADAFTARRAVARSRRSRRWLLPGAGLSGLLALLALALPILERSQIDGVVNERTRRVLNGAAWQWQGLVAAGTPPGEATETVSDALHARIVSSGTERVEIPFMTESNVDALHDSFRLNPFIRSSQPRTIDPVERRELSESATRVAVLATAVQRHEFDVADAEARKHMASGAVLALLAGVLSVALIMQWRRRADAAIAALGGR